MTSQIRVKLVMSASARGSTSNPPAAPVLVNDRTVAGSMSPIPPPGTCAVMVALPVVAAAVPSTIWLAAKSNWTSSAPSGAAAKMPPPALLPNAAMSPAANALSTSAKPASLPTRVSPSLSAISRKPLSLLIV